MAKKKTKVSKSKNPPLVVQSKLKELVKKNKMKCSSDVVQEMNNLITDFISRGVQRAKANGRKTLRGADL